jgi:hypothetical protein
MTARESGEKQVEIDARAVATDGGQSQGLTPIVMLNAFQHPCLKVRCQTDASQNGSSGEAWILKQVQDDEKLEWTSSGTVAPDLIRGLALFGADRKA